MSTKTLKMSCMLASALLAGCSASVLQSDRAPNAPTEATTGAYYFLPKAVVRLKVKNESSKGLSVALVSTLYRPDIQHRYLLSYLPSDAADDEIETAILSDQELESATVKVDVADVYLVAVNVATARFEDALAQRGTVVGFRELQHADGAERAGEIVSDGSGVVFGSVLRNDDLVRTADLLDARSQLADRAFDDRALIVHRNDDRDFGSGLGHVDSPVII